MQKFNASLIKDNENLRQQIVTSLVRQEEMSKRMQKILFFLYEMHLEAGQDKAEKQPAPTSAQDQSSAAKCVE